MHVPERYILVGRRPGLPICYYLAENGRTTTNADKACPVRGLDAAKREIDYFRANTFGFNWTIERLKPRLSVAKAILSATTVDY